MPIRAVVNISSKYQPDDMRTLSACVRRVRERERETERERESERARERERERERERAKTERECVHVASLFFSTGDVT